jgi:hypothetical protein
MPPLNGFFVRRSRTFHTDDNSITKLILNCIIIFLNYYIILWEYWISGIEFKIVVMM